MEPFWGKKLRFGVRAISGKGDLGLKPPVRSLVSVCACGAQGGQEADLRKRRDLGGSDEMGKEGLTELSFADSVPKPHLAFTCSFCS